MGMMRSDTKGLQWLACALLALSATACLSGLDVQTVRHGAQSPSQVAVFLTVANEQSSLEDLDVSNFRLTENGTALDASDAELRLLDRDVAVAHHTLVLVDLGGPILTPADRALLAEQLSPFIDRVRAQQDVTVVGFDAANKLYPLARFSKKKSDASDSLKQLKSLTTHRQGDTSRNLNGASLLALKDLQARLSDDKRPIALGNLVVIMRGPDLSGRTSEDELADALDASPHKVYAVTVGANGDQEHGELIGRDGAFNSNGLINLDEALAKLADRLVEDYERYYLLSYCSPARAGLRTLVVEVSHKDAEGEPLTGNTEVEFRADGFTAGCKSTAIPTFSTLSDNEQPGSTSRSSLSSRKSRKSNSGHSLGSRPASGASDEDPKSSDDADNSEPEDGQPASDTPDPSDETIVPPPARPGYAQ